MVSMVSDSPSSDGMREITFEYDAHNEDDRLLLEKLRNIISNEQSLCTNCENFLVEPYFCGYRAHRCRIHGNLESFENPHYDGDGSKCGDYRRKCSVDKNT